MPQLESINQICKDCGSPFTISPEEQERFLDLQRSNPDFKMPKRCKDCRKAKRLQRDAEAESQGQPRGEQYKPRNHMKFPRRDDADREMGGNDRW